MATWSELPSLRIAANVGAAYVPEFWEAEVVPEAFAQLKMRELAEVFPKIGLNNGEVYHITLGGTMGNAGTIAVGTKVVIDSTIGLRGLNGTMREWGRGLEIQKRLLQLAPQDPLVRWYRNELQRNIALAIDSGIRDALYAATTIRVNGGTWLKDSTGTFTIFGTYASGKCLLPQVRKAAEQLQVQNAPMFPGDTYMGIFHPYQISDMFADTTANSGLVPVSQYTERGIDKLFRFEIGMVYNTRIVRSTNIQGTLEQASTGTVQLARAIIAGAGAVGWVLGSLPEIYFDDDYQKDFKRVQALAWLMNANYQLIKDPYAALIQTTVPENITGNGVA